MAVYCVRLSGYLGSRLVTIFLPQMYEGPSVFDFGADPNGGVDSTAAFTAARTATGRSEAIRVPAGTYLIDAGGVDLASRMWIGDISFAGRPESVLRARTAATNFLTAATQTYLQSLVFDANFLTDRALTLSSAHNSFVYNVDCRHANEYAFYSNETNVAPIVRLTCRNSANGARMQGPNGNSVVDFRALNNDGFGVEILGLNSGETVKSGQMSFFGFTCSGNGGDGVRVLGALNGMISGGVIEDNVGDGVVLDDECANILFNGLRISGDGSNDEVAIRAVDGSLCTFRGITVTGEQSSYERALILEPSSVLQFYGARKSDGEHLDLVYSDGVTEYTAHPDGADLKGTGVPTAGAFRRNQLVWNDAPVALSNRGWRCLTAGSPGSWESF